MSKVFGEITSNTVHITRHANSVLWGKSRKPSNVTFDIRCRDSRNGDFSPDELREIARQYGCEVVGSVDKIEAFK